MRRISVEGGDVFALQHALGAAPKIVRGQGVVECVLVSQATRDVGFSLVLLASDLVKCVLVKDIFRLDVVTHTGGNGPSFVVSLRMQCHIKHCSDVAIQSQQPGRAC